MRRGSKILLAILLLGSLRAHASEDPLGIHQTIWGRVAEIHDLDPYQLYSVALVEARRKWRDGLVRPWPWAITKNGKAPKSYYPESREEAQRILDQLLQETTNLDIGMMQINYHWHGHRVANPADLLDMQTNLEVAAMILTEALASAPADPELGIGRYHSWQPSRARKYGKRVIFLTEVLRGGR